MSNTPAGEVTVGNASAPVSTVAANIAAEESRLEAAKAIIAGGRHRSSMLKHPSLVIYSAVLIAGCFMLLMLFPQQVTKAGFVPGIYHAGLKSALSQQMVVVPTAVLLLLSVGFVS